MTSPKRYLVFRIIGALLLTLSLQAHSLPISLTDAELDNVTAGYVNLIITSDAAATGEHSITIAVTDVNVRQTSRGRKGRTRTVATGYGFAQAIGDSVTTQTSFNLDTNERIVSFRAVRRIQNSDGSTTVVRIRVNRHGRVTVHSSHRPARHRNGRGQNPNSQTNTLRVRVVTRGR